jgi:hypothetical protein
VLQDWLWLIQHATVLLKSAVKEAQIGESLIDGRDVLWHKKSRKSTRSPEVQMTPDERERMQILCERIAEGRNNDTFTKLLQELNELLDGQRRGGRTSKVH